MIKLVRSFGARILSDIEPVTVRKRFGAPESAKLHDQFEYVIEKRGEHTEVGKNLAVTAPTERSSKHNKP